MSATIKDVAARTGLSVSTVSQILNTRRQGLFKPATRDLVIETARSLRYRPNAHARGINSGRFGAVGLLMGSGKGRSTLPEDSLRGLSDRLSELDLNLIVATLPEEQLSNTSRLPRLLRELSVDGLIVNYTHGGPHDVETLFRELVPASVWMNRKHDTDSVYADDYAAAYALTERLLQRGHQRIVYVNYSHGWRTIGEAHHSEQDRQAGYEKAMSDAGFKPVVFMEDEYVEHAKCEMVSRQMLAALKPTAVVAQGPKVCGALIFAARAMGLEAPRDLSIVSFFDQQRLGSPTGIQITAMIAPKGELGEVAADMVSEKLDGTPEPLASRVLPFRLLEGSTDGDCIQSS